MSADPEPVVVPGRAAPDADREQTILSHLPLVRALARRYADRGESLDDLVQVGTLGLIKAVDRYDRSKGTNLAAYAAPTILGEIRRHFRDRAWAVHVPRPLQEAHAAVGRAVAQLTGSLGRAPSVAEIAEATGLDEEVVLDATAAGGAYRPLSLSAPRPGADEEADALEPGGEDEGYAVADGRAVLAGGLRTLPARERVILHLRFREGLTQSEIAARVGLSQMHVSRLIRRALEHLRREAGA